MKYSLEEQETHIYYEPIDKAWIYESSYAPHIKRLLKFKKYIVKQETDDAGHITAIKLAIPNNQLLINPFPKPHRKYSAAQKAKMRENLQKNIGGNQS